MLLYYKRLLVNKGDHIYIYFFAEFLSLSAILLSLYSVLQTNNKNLFFINFLENLVIIFKNFILQGYSAVIVQIFGSILLLFQLKQNKIKYKTLYFVVVIMQIIIGLLFNNKGIIGLLPILASSGYYLLIIFVQKNILIKILLVINLSIWIVYYLFLKDYIGAVSNFISVLFTIMIIRKQIIIEKNS